MGTSPHSNSTWQPGVSVVCGYSYGFDAKAGCFYAITLCFKRVPGRGLLGLVVLDEVADQGWPVVFACALATCCLGIVARLTEALEIGVAVEQDFVTLVRTDMVGNCRSVAMALLANRVLT